ncbi:hypothetical protein FRC05_007823 [Tulasnella sp. 425]|nr:hypothetical protein FRC05_007823 [Tulasnella sp. 425]
MIRIFYRSLTEDAQGDGTTLYMAGMDYLIKKPGDLEFQFGEFNTKDDHPVTKPQARTICRIDVERPFVTPPKVVTFLKSFDLGGSSTHIKTGISGVDAKGFTMTIESWADTTLYRAIAGWVAYPEDKEHIFSGTANNMDVHAWDHPQAKQEKDVSFEGVSFWKKPSVFMAFNWLDISTARNPRVRAYVDNVDKGGMTWHIDSWADTELWVADISYIAFN